MAELIILWIYILILSTILGTGTLRIIDHIVGINRSRSDSSKVQYSFMAIQLAGLIFITLYSQIWSVFGRVSAVAHIGLVVTTIVMAYFVYKKGFPYDLKNFLWSWEGALYIILILATAFFASRGAQHTDTYIYHAEMIRWYEEYGVVTGLGNLQNHFAYNSAYLAYAAIFSMKWIVGQSLHGTGGFIQALMVVWAMHGLLRMRQHKHHGVDACRVAIIIYAIVNSEYIMSPATDFGALYMVLWIMTLWVSIAWPEKEDNNLAENEIDEKIHKYALLCVAICVATTFKLAAGMMVVAAIYPAISLIKNKKVKEIFIYLGLGIIALLPWVIRNIIISGCIVYPLDVFRLSFLEWTIPSAYLAEDNAGITTWARCLFDRELVDVPIPVWLPIWWDAKDTYEKMLILCNIIAVMAEILYLVKLLVNKFVGKNKSGSNVNMAMACFKLMIAACLIIWFVQAPFIRYGLAFLLVFPLVEVAQWVRGIGSDIREVTVTPLGIGSGFLITGILLCMAMYLNYYTLNDVNLAKAHLFEPYYLVQKDYEAVEYRTFEMDCVDGTTVTVYYPDYDQDNSYAPIPSTACIQMGERTKLRGTDIRQGFAPK